MKRPSPLPHHSQVADPDSAGPDPRTAAEARLRRHPHHALRKVVCRFEDGALVLTGRLPSYYLKQLAQEAVAGLDGVARVDNRIEVVRPGPRR